MRPKTQTQWEVEMCEKILILLKDSLYLDFRYLDRALNALSPVPDERIRTFAVDGTALFFSTEQILRLYPKNPLFLQRALLHSTLHCIFRHLWIRRNREPGLWHLACDIVVERMIDAFRKSSVLRALSGIRTSLYRELEDAAIPVTAANVYDYLADASEDRRRQLAVEFFVDDHRYWPKEETLSPMQKQAGDMWNRIGRRTDQELSTRAGEAGDASSILHTQVEASRPGRSYADFLRRFTVLHEEMHIDQDSYDPGYYSYGLRLYKNMPLIEHPESREISKILEFVIVLDTSYSTSGELVRLFLHKTFDIIRQRDHFFRESRIHIIQADSKVQTHEIIKNEKDIDRMMTGFDLKGGGSTDFRPAFAYIDRLRKEGELRQMKGLLYFTDGKGTFPKKAPAYRTAFVFIGADSKHPVPDWAMRVELRKEELIR